MMTFDGWDARFYGDAMALPDDALMHFRTRGSKNGVRRFQLPSGEWTPLGLRERKKREGWGESKAERKAEKRVARAEKKVARAEQKAERKAQAKESLIRRTKRKENVSSLSDEELRRKIQRAKMEAEYNEITKSPILKTGERVFEVVMKRLEAKDQRKFEREKMALETLRINADVEKTKADIVRSKEQTKTAKENAKKAKSEAREKKFDYKGGLKFERKANLTRAEKDLKESTFVGSLIKTHKEAKLARIENKKRINEGMAFVKSTIRNANAVSRHNKFKKNKLNFTQESYKGELKDKHTLNIAKQVAKQKENDAKKAAMDKDKAYWEWKKAGRKTS